MTAVKTGPIEGERTQFRTQMVNGKPQIYFDTLDESPVKPKAKRNSRAINTTPLPEQSKTKPTNQKPVPQNSPNKQTKKINKVTFNDNKPPMGVYMTMDEISELVKAVKENTEAQMNTTTTTTKENREPSLPPPPPTQQQEFMQVPVTVQVPKSYELPLPPIPLAPISPREEALGMMADKKRQKWMREKAEMDRMKLEVEYDQLKHQLSPIHQNVSSSPERSTIPFDYSLTSRPPLPPSVKQNDNSQNDLYKTRLMEKKQQQWKQENAEKAPVWNPFGRPGAGAPNTNELPPKISQPSSNIVMPYRPPDSSSIPSNIVLNDQTRVPAAMRTNLLFGDVRFEDDVKTAKEIERRQWLDDLQKQIEDNKRQKFTQQETERRQDFLHENVQPLLQEAANRHQQQQKDPLPSPSSNTLITSHSGQDLNKTNRHDSIVKQTYDKIVEATELAKYEKKAQLIDKLKRNGHKTDLLAQTLPDVKTVNPNSTQKSNEKILDPSPKKTTASTTTTTKIEPLQLNMGNDQQSYRINGTRRDEAVNTMDSTFRSDNSAQTDLRMVPQKQMFSFTREESDLPPQIPNHLLRNSKQNKKNVRIRSLEDQPSQRALHTKPISHDDSMSTQRSNQPLLDIVHRPLWNYQNPQHREYVPNSKRYLNSDKRQRSQENFNRIDDKQKKPYYNRGNSDSELQHEQKNKNTNSTNRTQSTGSKYNHSKDENFSNNLIKQHKLKEDTFILTNTDDELNYNNISSLDKYQHFTPYIRTDQILDPARAFSPVPLSRETSAQRQRTVIYDDHHRKQNTTIQPPPYHVPPSRQEHILRQLTAIKENLVRRQQEVTTSMNAIPV